MRSCAARSASRTASSTVRRSTCGMEATGSRRLHPFDQEQRPDQIIDVEAALAHEAARPLGLAVAPRTLRQREVRRGIVARCGAASARVGRARGVSFGGMRPFSKPVRTKGVSVP